MKKKITSLALGMVGGALDFFSGASFLLAGNSMRDDATLVMMPPNGTSPVNAELAWGIGLIALGVLLVVTSFLAAISRMKGSRSRLLAGPAMVIYGIVMISIGIVMLSGFAPTMQNSFYSPMVASSLSGFGMLIVGGLMVISGGSMSRSGGMGTMPETMGGKNTRKSDFFKRVNCLLFARA